MMDLMNSISTVNILILFFGIPYVNVGLPISGYDLPCARIRKESNNFYVNDSMNVLLTILLELR